MPHNVYDNPLISRYASREMAALWSEQRKFSTWRRMWLWLAEAEQELGLKITDDQLEEMRLHLDDVDFTAAAKYERKLRHDVMAHVHAFGDACPVARPIIHLGATSCTITDNTDLILLREALQQVTRRLAAVLFRLTKFATAFRELPCLAFTHLQPAQPTTVGKRACLWMHDLAIDLEEVEHRITSLKALSVKGTTGTQASFLSLFHGDHEKVRQLERLFAAKMGFAGVYPVSGQTYTRKVDSQVLEVLGGIAQSAEKLATDLRILASHKEVEEPFEPDQIGSSAMAYKRNPMRSERICGLARFVLSLQSSTAQTAATQWLERTLDDSANRRLVIPQAFLATDAILILLENITSGLVVYPEVMRRHIREELPFMATENILMAAVELGGDRQDMHERLRRHSLDAGNRVKREGRPNDLLERLRNDPAFAQVNLEMVVDEKQYIGRAAEQVREYLAEHIQPLLARYPQDHGLDSEVKV